MKKNNLSGYILTEKIPIKHFLLIMRTTTLLLFTFVLCAMAEKSYTQNTKVTINERNVTLKKVLNEIELQTDYLFIYNNEVNTSEKISIKAIQKSVASVLNAIFSERGIDYSMQGKHIILSVIEKEDALSEANSMSTDTQQQNKKQITGKIEDINGIPIIGANIIEIGTSSNGTITDIDGNFSLNVEKNATIRVSYIGYLDQEISTVGKTSFEILLKEDTRALDEVVVVGYGTQRKVNLTGTVNTISSGDIANKASTSLANAMQGLLPGVTVISRPGDVGSNSGLGNINVRGRGNLGKSSPLFIVDGVPVTEAGFQRINPNDVESISILKDAAASSIYGSRAAYGVFLITTKKGKEGKATVSYNGYYGWQSPTVIPKKLDAYNFAMLTNESLANAGKKPAYDQQIMELIKSGENPDLYPNNDWYSLVYRNKTPMQEHSISVSGGGKTRYYVSGTFFEQESLVKGRILDRYSIRANTERDFSNIFRLGTNIALIKDDFKRDGNFGTADLDRMTPLTVARQSDGSWGSITGGAISSVLASNNPLRMIEEFGWKKENTTRLNSSINARLSPISGLDINSIISYNYMYKNSSEFFNKVAPIPNFLDKTKPPIASTAVNTNELKNRWDNTSTFMSQFFATYSKSWGMHETSLMIGSQFEKYRTEYLLAGRKNFPSNNIGAIDGGSSSYENLKNAGNIYERAFMSEFGRLNYAYAGKYLFEANMRIDNSSQFYKDNRTGYFPSFSAAWRVSEENFMRNQRSWLDNLKLRLSWGKLGNIDNVGDYDYYDVLGTGTAVIMGENKIDGVWPGKPANPELSWENITMKNLGIDASILRNKINLQLDIFDKLTDNILLKMPAPLEMGLKEDEKDINNDERTSSNAGKVSNKGFELSLNYRDQIGNFNYSFSGNVSKIWNEVIDLNGLDNQINDLYIYKIGKSIGSFYTYQADGLFKDQADVNGHMEQHVNTKPGDIKYKDVHKDNKFNEDDRTITGNDVPYFTYGLGFNASYKGFDFSLLGQGVKDVKVYLSSEASQAFFNGAGAKEYHLKRWTKENPDPNAAYPRVLQTADNEHNLLSSSFWLYNADYFRIKNISLGYTIPNSLTKKMMIERLRIYINGTNLLTFRGDKRMKDFDPEMPSARGSYPNMKVISFGMNINF